MDIDYTTFAIVGKSKEHKAWLWKTWSQIVQWLNPIVALTNEKVGVRSLQDFGAHQHELRFGQLGWNEKSHQKWTHASLVNGTESLEWRFFFTEIWAPRWTTCQREHRDPALFVMVKNPFITLEPKEEQFNQFLQLSVPWDLFINNQKIIDAAIKQIAELLESTAILVRVIPWNVRGDWVQDALNNHLRYIGMYDDVVFDVSKTIGKWLDYEPRTSS
jgi:hypothetical protein